MSDFVMNVMLTSRGFEFVDFEDENDVACSLQQSSAVGNYEDAMERPGSSAIWLGCKKNRPPHMGDEASPRMHLNREQVCELVERLENWLRTGSFKDD